MVVPVLVAFGSGSPRSARKLFLDRSSSGWFAENKSQTYLIVFEKSKPGEEYTEAMTLVVEVECELRTRRCPRKHFRVTLVVPRSLPHRALELWRSTELRPTLPVV